MTNTRRVIIGIVIILIIMISTSFNTIINFITEYKWFQELGFEKVFLTKLITQLKIGVPVFIVATILIYIYLISIKKDYYKKVNVVHTGISEKRINQIALIGAVFLSFISSSTIAGNLWFDILRYFNSTDFKVTEPIFNKDISFYIFKYPMITKIYYMLISFIVLLAVTTIIFYVIMMILRRPTLIEVDSENQFSTRQMNLNNGKRIFDIALRQLVVLGIIFFLVLGLGYYLRAYDLLYSQRGVVYGASYTDIKVILLKFRVIMIVAFISAILLFLGARRKKLRLAISGPVLMIVISIVGNLTAFLVQSYIVSPDEISKETKYIEYNIKYTQKAYGLEDVEERKFPADTTLTLEDLKENEETISNIRINDYRPTELVYNQKQGIRHYYKFNDVDIDRYYIDGKYRQVFLSPRELDQSQIKEERQTFINKHLIYTHGYGIVMSPVNKITSEGLPEMLIKNIPPITNTEGFKIERPEIYFGELTNDYIIVNTKEKEFDYPKGNSNVENIYEGNAGIKLRGLNKLLYAYKQGSLKMLLAGSITSESKIVLNRNIHDRVRKIMPYIEYDSDPYIALYDGKIYWIIDGYTVSSNYPYSEPISDSKINYIRNSVKVVIDAYNGDTTYYLADENDPIVKTYSKIFPQLFTSIDEMPEGLKAHIRYPQVLFDIQADVYRIYHMEDPRVFYNQEDEWYIANEKYENENQLIESNYLLMKLPEEEKEEFILSIPYTPKEKPNMTALLVGRNDGENYGELVVYKLPKSKNVYGPMQIENRIDSEPTISKEFTFWNQQGSSVIRGNLLTIPIEDSLLYVEPIYLKADAKDSLPEVKRVIVAYGEKIVMEPTLEGSLERIFGKSEEEPKPDIPKPTEPINPSQPTIPAEDIDDISQLIINANDVFERSIEAQRQGDWAEYGRFIEELKIILNRLDELKGTQGMEH
ncbi:UPF0182 family membrane protein [Paramaledivibacter caminithermalis]|uniref:UPF0182 protein SAMN02745912_03128 n=1 Tax=Paramaledivibacter caminithermalis (strain DSM 15212 / CIP 107654 / DViRD3) TaxID=1121301 RepID=A0A1M6RZT1_PARC5|nr:UPF0182 family protein [Paramaledivibacter caminithermalis]SHK37848.1 hypothetical protein SAMN02745912_03128 [Paramaledivibacter caminithermalis DSM 15212]